MAAGRTIHWRSIPGIAVTVRASDPGALGAGGWVAAVDLPSAAGCDATLNEPLTISSLRPVSQHTART